MTLANLSIYYTWKNIKCEYKSNKFKVSTPTWNDTFDLLDGSYSIRQITLNLSLKNVKLYLKIDQFKFIQIKLKTELFLK